MTIRPCVCIPVYNNPGTIVSVIEKTLRGCDLPLVIVDDGSTESVEELCRRQGYTSSSRLQFLRHETNEGKGAAIVTSFKWALGQAFTHVITMDGDGQHYPTEIGKIIQQTQKTPWALILGNRDMSAVNVPESSRFGRKFSNFWVQYTTTVNVSDSQSGFRCYPLFQIQTMSFFSKRYDFEAEILTRLIWKGVDVIDVPIAVHYPPAGERVSHFDKLRDNARITVIHTSFVILSLLKDNASPLKSALAVGMGVFVGCTPLLGLHTLIVAAMAFVFRLNFIYLWLGTNISLPPLTPILAVASGWIGGHLLNSPAETAAQWSLNWAAGSVLLGSVLGGLVGSITYLFKTIKARKSAKIWTGKTRGGRFGNNFMKNLVGRFGVVPGYMMLVLIVPYFYVFAFAARRGCNEYWKVVSPGMSFFRRQFQILQQLFVFAQILVDRVYQSQHLEPKFSSQNKESIDNVKKALELQKGVLTLGIHAGGWDIAASLIRMHNLQRKLYMIHFDGNAVYHHSAHHKDAHETVTLFHNKSENSLLKIRDLLESNSIIGIMGDRPLTSNFELVPLFDKLALLDTTVFRVAALTGSPIVISFGFKVTKDSYTFETLEPLVLQWDRSRAREEQILEWAKIYAQAIEANIKKYPEQWFNFYNYWSKVPDFVLSESREVPVAT